MIGRVRRWNASLTYLLFWPESLVVEDLSAADWEENGIYARVSVGPAVCGSVIEMGRSATFHPFLVIPSACVAIKSASKVVGRRRQGSLVPTTSRDYPKLCCIRCVFFLNNIVPSENARFTLQRYRFACWKNWVC
ncbi:hypothetical protein JTE90_017158 [Oedothorax gibbosus]|uniref:Uncharacterized protein n=1 Tax=Oedothorax gibbosus TaxID=931172 RepID=A0AAV6TKR1_9ARAC|nr:hypothetical protein JTE90_017158 [Oedothorax gibbosus]